jgi:hypothetical protein
VAIKSALNPGAIVNENPVSLSAATNFITGGAPLGQSILSSAANKIVGFEKPGSAAVAPKVPDLGSIINTLSTSILNNVENRVQSINQNVVSIVNNKLQTLESDYAGRLSKVETDKPNNILKNFLSLYQDAIGFIQFLSNKNNIKTLGNNLDALRKVFEETFNVAKIIRQTIIKIVDQLSNLPTADTAGGGGLNLDINIPGANILKQVAPKGLTKNLGKFGKAALIGGAAVGAGALGSQVVSGMLDVGGDVNAAPMGDQSGGLSGPILDKFNGILDKFAAAIANFKPGEQQKKPGLQKGAPSAGPAPGETPPGTPPDLSSTGKKGVIEYAQQKGFSEQFTAGLLTQVSHESGGNPFAYNPDDLGKPSYGTFQFRAGRGDQMIKYLEANGIPNAKSIFTNPKDPRRNDKELQKKALALEIQYFTESEKDTGTPAIKAAEKSTDLNQVQNAFFGGERFLGYDNPSSPEYRSRAADIQSTYQQLHKTKALQKTPQVSAAPTKSTTAQQVSQQVAQTPGANQPSKTSVVPLNLSSKEQTKQNKPATVTQRPVMSTKGTVVPYLDSSNDNNQHILSSRIQYGLNL